LATHTSHAVHQHNLEGGTADAAAQINLTTGIIRILRRTGLSSWTPTVGRLFTDGGSDTTNETVGAQLVGNTDENASAQTHSAHGVYNYYRLAFIMKT
jgi:hypothetical protein